MRNLIYKSLLIAICSATIIGCKPKLDDLPEPTANGVDFSKYISIGDGTPAGYANGALNRESQLVAFPNLLAKQFELVGGPSTFVQPLLEEGKTYGYENGLPTTSLDLIYTTFCDNSTELYPIQKTPAITLLDILNFTIPEPGPYNNLAAQGTKMVYVNKKPGWFHAPSTSSTAATYWQKISSTKSTTGVGAATMLSDALAQNPTFVSLNLGVVDVMRYAKSGGDQFGGDDDMITPLDEFHDSLYSIMNALKANNPNIKGLITNIIDLNSWPYITHIKYDGLILSQAQADDLNAHYTSDGFTFKQGRNAYVVADAVAPNGRRRMKEGEFILVEIPQDSLRCYNMGGKLPIRKRWLLDETEVATINTTIAAYNAILKAAAKTYNFAFVDGNASMKLVKAETKFQGIPLTTDFVTGNQFSLDGLNISPLGQAALANNCISQINLTYGSTIPMVDVTKIKAVQFH